MGPPSRKNAMKKLFSLVLALCLLCMALTACGEKKNDATELPLIDMIETIYGDVDAPAYEAVPLDRDNFEYFTFVPYAEGLEACEADALINATPHSVVLIHCADGDVAALAQKVAENANPRKWICTAAEKTQIAYTQHYVLLLMSETNLVDDMLDNFRALAADMGEGDVTVLDSAFVDTGVQILG